MRRLSLLATWAALLGLAGCFPYRETYRPETSGRVVDLDDTPIAGARVEVCSESGWIDLEGKCPRRGTATTAADGRFHFDPRKEWEWCCTGEAPLPVTLVSVCAPDGRLSGAIFDSSRDPANLTLVVRPPASFAVGRYGQVIGEGSLDPRREVLLRCGADPARRPAR